MGGITGSGKGGQKQSKQLDKIAGQTYKDSTPTRQLLLGQTEEALRTGGVGAQIPSIQRAVESQKGALSSGLKATTDSISTIPGLAGTPFAESILASQRTSGEANIAGIPSQVAGQFISGASNLALGFPQIASQAYGSSGGLQSEHKGQQLSFLASLFSSAMGGAGAAK